jgi:hypothetical protein
MNLLSIDVGIKNLGLCLINISEKTNNIDNSKEQNICPDYYIKILNWNVINLCGEKKENCKCGKNANYINNNIFSCKKHIKDFYKPLIPNELLIHNLKKKKINELKSILVNNKIDFDHSKSKILLLDDLEKKLKNDFFIPYKSEIKASEIDLVTVGKNIKHELDKLYENTKIDKVIIENQISPIANRMKTVQGMLAQYFIMKDVEKIYFISASNKLKDYTSSEKKCDDLDYNQRKKLSVEVSEELLINQNLGNYLEYFNSHKKKDDLADCFLQGLWYIKYKI